MKKQLGELAFELFQHTCLDRLSVIEDFEKSPDDLSSRIVNNSAEVEKLANSILEILGPQSALQKSADVITIVFEEGLPKVSEDDANWDDEGLRQRIVQRLTDPFDIYHFNVPASAGSPLRIDINLGGDNQLKISHKKLRKDVFQAHLSGCTRTIAVGHAREFAELTLRSFLGISMAIGIADVLPFSDLTIPIATITNDETGFVYERMLSPLVGSQAARMQFHTPTDLDDLETKKKESSNRRLRSLRTVMSSNLVRARELRRAGSLLFDATAQQDVGLEIAVCFMSIEAVLLDPNEKSDISARLREAVAYRLGKSSAERRDLRKKIKDLYDARSKVVHTGEVPSGYDSDDLIRLAREVLRKEIEELPFDI